MQDAGERVAALQDTLAGHRFLPQDIRAELGEAAQHSATLCEHDTTANGDIVARLGPSIEPGVRAVQA